MIRTDKEKFLEKIKENIDIENLKEDGKIFSYVNRDYLAGDNKKYMNMYDKLSFWYDFGEKWIGLFRYGNTIFEMRKNLMKHLEWRNGISVLYVSIGTGKDLNFIPQNVDLKSLDFTGIDISYGMLKKCHSIWKKRTNLTLVNCCAEDLPFKDNVFDIVFHVGGINFFTDKALAIKEMIRVSKPGSKIMIADETEDFIGTQYKKSIFTKNYYKNTDFDLSEIQKCIPESVKEKKTDFLWNNRFYCITFRK